VGTHNMFFLIYKARLSHSMSMSHSAKAANQIKQEAGFHSCFPDETVEFNYEELYNSKSKHYFN